MLKELLPYTQYNDKRHFRYYIFFVEEGIQNPKYINYRGGRCEVRVDEHYYSINEYRFFTKKKSFLIFRNWVECKHFNIIGLWVVRLILKYYYYEIIR